MSLTYQQQELYLNKDNRRRLNGWVFDDNLQTTMNTFSETLCFLHVDFKAILDHITA